jgi:hypothetical protein
MVNAQRSVVSLLDIAAQFSGASLRWKALASLRTVRAARVLRLVRIHTAWADNLGRIAVSVPAALYAVGVLMVFCFTFAMLGMQVRFVAKRSFFVVTLSERAFLTRRSSVVNMMPRSRRGFFRKYHSSIFRRFGWAW